MSDKIYQIAVIGSGAAGVMATLRGVLNNDEVLLLPGAPRDKKRSRAFWVAKVENMPGYQDYKKGIDNPNKDTLDWIAESDFKNNLTIVKNSGAKTVEKIGENFKIIDDKENTYLAEFVVLCTGIMDVQPHFKGSIQPILPYANAQTVDYCLRCDGHHVLGKHTSIVGNGDGAAWVAIMLKERYNTPSMAILTNGEVPEFGEDVKQLLDIYKIEVFDSEIIEVLGDTKSGRLDGYRFKSGRQIQSEFSFVSMGTIVYNEIAKAVGAEVDQRGYVLTDAKGMTKTDKFFVAGDIRAGFKKQIYTAWDMAVDSMDEINRRIRQARREKLLQGK